MFRQIIYLNFYIHGRAAGNAVVTVVCHVIVGEPVAYRCCALCSFAPNLCILRAKKILVSSSTSPHSLVNKSGWYSPNIQLHHWSHFGKYSPGLRKLLGIPPDTIMPILEVCMKQPCTYCRDIYCSLCASIAMAQQFTVSRGVWHDCQTAELL